MAQPVAAYQWANIGTVGTVNLTNRNCILKRVVIPGTYTGTVNFYDTATPAGTSATNLILSLGLPATAVAGAVEIDANCKQGLTYASTGTPIMTVLWD